MAQSKIRVGIVGYGGMGSWHADQIRESDVVQLAGIYDIRRERCEQAQEKGIGVYRSFRAMLEDETLDLVVVATPNDIHEDLVIKALRAGKHVICEKPVTLTLESLNRMIAAAEEEGRCFSTHQNRRWDSDYLAMKQIKESGEIGRVINMESRYHGSRGIPGDWRGEKSYGGGMLYDWGIHLIDQVLGIFGYDNVDSVFCQEDHITNAEVDDGFKLLINFKTGERAHIEVGTYNFINMPRFYMRAENGTAIINDRKNKNEPAQVVRCTSWHEDNVKPIQAGAGLTKTMAPRNEITTETYTVARPDSDVHDYYRNFVRAIRGEEELIVKHNEMRADLAVILAAFESARTGATVKIG